MLSCILLLFLASEIWSLAFCSQKRSSQILGEGDDDTHFSSILQIIPR